MIQHILCIINTLKVIYFLYNKNQQKQRTSTMKNVFLLCFYLLPHMIEQLLDFMLALLNKPEMRIHWPLSGVKKHP